MLVSIYQITERGLDLELERPDLVLDGADEQISLGGVKARFHLQWEERQLHIAGQVSAAISMHCSRCSKGFSFPIRESFDFMGLPVRGSKFPENLGLSADEMEVTFLEGEEIDLDEIIRENIYLSLPIQPLCSEACQGLCPRCGQDLNEGRCHCLAERVDPRFQALEILRQKISPESES